MKRSEEIDRRIELMHQAIQLLDTEAESRKLDFLQKIDKLTTELKEYRDGTRADYEVSL